MVKLIPPEKKLSPKCNMERVEKAIKELNSKICSPVTINIGRHLMNSYTQETIEATIKAAGFDVKKTIEGQGRYEILEVSWDMGARALFYTKG